MDDVIKYLCLSLNHGGHFNLNLQISIILSLFLPISILRVAYMEFSTKWFISTHNHLIFIT
jgi:hypothetical protein